MNPSQGARSATDMDLDITGENTNFVSGASVATFSGLGITAVSTMVTSATKATVRIDIASDATLGFRDIVITTGGESAAILNGFQVVDLPALVASILPSAGRCWWATRRRRS